MKSFIVSDCHGFYTNLMNSLNTAGFDSNNPEHILIICGDLFDRGKQPREIFDFVRTLPKERLIYIRGNHEDLLMECLNEIYDGYNPGRHHYHNGTVETIFNFCGITNFDFWERRDEAIATIKKYISPLVDFINERCVDYYETDTHIFVHGWIPCEVEGGIHYGTYKRNDDWRNASRAEWKKARWFNGMDCAKYWYILEPHKTIVCGHWHCSYGHYIFGESKTEDNYTPFYSDGIIAIDACTAKSGMVNCIIIDGCETEIRSGNGSNSPDKNTIDSPHVKAF